MRLSKFSLFTSDVTMLLLAFGAGALIRVNDLGDFSHLESWWQADGQYRIRAFGLAATLGLLRYAVSLSHYSVRRPYWDELRNTLMTLLAMALIDAAVLYMAQWDFSRLSFLTTWLAAFLLVPTGRILTKRLLTRAGLWQRPVVLIGPDIHTHAAWLALKSDALLGYQLTCIITTTPDADDVWQGQRIQRIPLDPQGAWQSASSRRLVIIAQSDQHSDHCEAVIRQLSNSQTEYLIIPPASGLPMYGLETQHMLSHDVLVLHAFNRSAQLPSRVAKRLFDIVGSASLLLLLSPALLWLCWRVSRSGKPIIFKHIRIGRNNKPFPCPKFRTMVPNAQEVLKTLLANDPAAREEWEREFKLRNDPRITEIGHFLRKSSLDELPQLWSVLKGDMSLVGPRPVIAEELARYGDSATYYTQVRPGMTGLWQVSGRNDVDYATRVALDSWYVQNWSMWYDIAILFKTIGVVANKDGAY